MSSLRLSRLPRFAMLALAVALSMGAYQCRIGPTPPVGTQGLPVPYHPQFFDATSQTRNYCVPASLLMVRDFYQGTYTSNAAQHQLWTDMTLAGWTTLSSLFPGVLTQYLDDAFAWQIGLPYQLHVYQGADRAQALADAEKSISLNHPVPAITFAGTHLRVC